MKRGTGGVGGGGGGGHVDVAVKRSEIRPYCFKIISPGRTLYVVAGALIDYL